MNAKDSLFFWRGPTLVCGQKVELSKGCILANLKNVLTICANVAGKLSQINLVISSTFQVRTMESKYKISLKNLIYE